jgi:hypothetical protein
MTVTVKNIAGLAKHAIFINDVMQGINKALPSDMAIRYTVDFLFLFEPTGIDCIRLYGNGLKYMLGEGYLEMVVDGEYVKPGIGILCQVKDDVCNVGIGFNTAYEPIALLEFKYGWLYNELHKRQEVIDAVAKVRAAALASMK